MALRTALPEVLRTAVALVAVIVVNIGTAGLVERRAAARAAVTSALGPDAVSVPVAWVVVHA